MKKGPPSLADKHASELREMAAAHWSYAKMASVFGVHVNTVSLALERLELKHTPRWSRREFKTHPIIKKLREERMGRRLTMDQLAAKAGWDRSLIGEWERGGRRMHIAGLVDYANALGFDIALVKRA
jgi:DNA-binding XRE family transcriptional regulator